MSEPVEETPSGAGARQALAAAVLGDLLRLADVPARLDVKDGADGGISIALLLEADVPGVTGGRRGTFLDALQFLVNKLTHRPGAERRWVSLGLGEHPAPRGPRPPRPAPDSTVAARPAPQPQRPAAAPRAAVNAAPVAERSPVPEESSLEVVEDADLARSARVMAEASARTGRFYGLLALSPDDRARIVRAVADVPGVRAGIEGEGRLRRLVFTPERPTPMPRRAHPLDDDEDVAGTENTGS